MFVKSLINSLIILTNKYDISCEIAMDAYSLCAWHCSNAQYREFSAVRFDKLIFYCYGNIKVAKFFAFS